MSPSAKLNIPAFSYWRVRAGTPGVSANQAI
jgi:hypothetical protein